jgi:putative heme degradation protein
MHRGCRGGQALRNVVLNPSSDKKGLVNLEKTYKDFDDAFQLAMRLSQTDPELKGVMAEVQDKWKATLEARQRVLSVVNSNQTEAIKLLNDEETSAWRITRELLLKSLADIEKTIQEKNIT